VLRELIPKNPFAGLKGTVGSNRERDYFIADADARLVLDKCPDQEWRVLFALSRWGGLRCPSEHLELRWGDIDWERGRFTVRSPKTEHHEGGESRIVPLFPEVRAQLNKLWVERECELAESGKASEQPVITGQRTPNANLRTRLYKIVRRAGLTPWPKLFQNLRASRATELAAKHPAHVAAAWLGHSTLIANKHYWRVTDDDFANAVGSIEAAEENPMQNPMQNTPETTRKVSNAETRNPINSREIANSPVNQALLLGVEGLEPPTSTV
jgi:integrase